MNRTPFHVLPLHAAFLKYSENQWKNKLHQKEILFKEEEMATEYNGLFLSDTRSQLAGVDQWAPTNDKCLIREWKCNNWPN